MKSLLLVLFISILFSGCFFKPMPKCELPDYTFMSLCNSPVDLPKKKKFSQRIAYHNQDRESLTTCKEKHLVLVKSLKSCNKRIDTYNEKKGESENN